MSNKKTRNTLSGTKLIEKSSMTVRNRNNNSKPKFPDKSPVKKSPWPGINENATLSWEGNSRATSSSWPEDIEEVATRKVLDLWFTIERTLYNEDEQVPLGNVMDECIQWRTQISHFRLVGKSMRLEIADDDDYYETNVEQKSQKNSTEKFCDKKNHVVDNNDDDHDDEFEEEKKKTNSLSPYQLKVRDEVIDLIVDYISDELQKSSENLPSNSEDLDEVLRITPAPTYSGKRKVDSKKSSNINSGMSSANRLKTFELIERKNNNTVLIKNPKNAKNAIDNYDDDDESDSTDETVQLGRNKLGTVFNQKIVVSPVPFAVTTRESFCTLKTTPIKYAGHLLELSTPHGTSRNMKSTSKINSAHRMSLLRVPDRHSSWQTPIRSAVCPKNIRLAPIDPARLPSSKNRSSAVSTSIPHRQRNSLSPISRPIKTMTADSVNGDSLKIEGKKITTRTVKPNPLKTGWEYNPATQKNVKKKSKINSDR